MQETIKFLKKDRRVSDAFVARLNKAGLEVDYGKYSWWDGKPFVQIGRERVWLVSTVYDGNNEMCVFRYQNNVIEDIMDAIERQKKKAEQADELVESFFRKLETK